MDPPDKPVVPEDATDVTTDPDFLSEEDKDKPKRQGLANVVYVAGAVRRLKPKKGTSKRKGSNVGLKMANVITKATSVKKLSNTKTPSIEVSSAGEEDFVGEEVKKEDHSLLLNLIRKRQAKKKLEKESEKTMSTDLSVSSQGEARSTNLSSGGEEGARKARSRQTASKKSAPFSPSSLFGEEIKPALGKRNLSPSGSSRSGSVPAKNNSRRAELRSASSDRNTGIKGVLENAKRRKEELAAGGAMPKDVRGMLLVPGTMAGSSPRRKPPKSLKLPDTPVRLQVGANDKKEEKNKPAPTVREKFEEEAKRNAVASFLASPRRTGMVEKALTSITPAKPPGEGEEGATAKLSLAEVIIAASAAKAVKMKSAEEVPPPTLDEVAERQCRRLLILCQKGEWDSAGETLKALDILVAQETMDRRVLVETADRITGNTPLMYAAIENRISFMERMLALGCNVNKKNNENYTALHFAAMYSREDTVNWLLAKRANPNLKGGPMKQTCLHLAGARQSGQSGHIVKILLTAGSKEARFMYDAQGSLPLFSAIEVGNVNVARELLNVEAGRQLNETKQPLNDTPMHLAARRKDANMVKVLIEAGAQVDLQNKEGQTVLHLASIMGDEPTVRVLFLARANANVVDNEDRAPIHLAAERGFSTIVEFLAEKFKASIYERTRDGSTLMHIAANNGHPETALILFARGVPLLMPNKFGARGIHTAAKEGHVGVIHSLIQKGEKVDSMTGDDKTALHIAVEVIFLAT